MKFRFFINKKIKILIITFLGTSLFLSNFAYAETGFLKDLRLGMTDQDVSSLQKFLNNDPKTEVSMYGAGSKGSETDFFGEKTKDAVIRFQNLYKEEILSPVGLVFGTGFVGPSTRAKINSLLSFSINGNNSNETTVRNTQPVSANNPISQTIQQQISSSSNLNSINITRSIPPEEIVVKKVFLYGVSPRQVSPLGTITLSGQGFSNTGNTVFFGENNPVINVESSDGYTISVKIPETLSSGTFTISVSNADKIKSESVVPVSVVVTTNPSFPPKITDVSPLNANIGDNITITGSGFTASSNNIYSSLGNLNGLSSDGTKIIFSPKDLSEAKRIMEIPSLKGQKVSLLIYVQNDNGINSDPFKYEIGL